MESVVARALSTPVTVRGRGGCWRTIMISGGELSSQVRRIVRHSADGFRERFAARRSVGGLDRTVKRDLHLPIRPGNHGREHRPPFEGLQGEPHGSIGPRARQGNSCGRGDRAGARYFAGFKLIWAVKGTGGCSPSWMMPM
jgi:hypothetical protein